MTRSEYELHKRNEANGALLGAYTRREMLRYEQRRDACVALSRMIAHDFNERRQHQVFAQLMIACGLED